MSNYSISRKYFSRIRDSNINKSRKLKLLEENLIHVISQIPNDETAVDVTKTSGGKGQSILKIPLDGFQVFLVPKDLCPDGYNYVVDPIQLKLVYYIMSKGAFPCCAILS